jgi:hypothetical protein
MLNEEQVIRNFNNLSREREELIRMLERREQEKDQTEEYIHNMEYEIRDKEKKLQNVIEELTRKSNLNEEELLFLKGEIDKERRKSMADEQKMNKLQQILEENTSKTADRIRLI